MTPVNEAVRARLRDAVDALLNDDLHERLWLRGERRDAAEPTFDDVVLFIVDELATPQPTELVGHVLVDERELDAFVRLAKALERLVSTGDTRLGFADVVHAGPEWQTILKAARDLRDLLR